MLGHTTDPFADVELTDVQLFRFVGRLRQPLRTARGVFSERETVLLQLHATVAGLDVRGWGEAAPLAGWGSDSLGQARLELGRVRDLVHSGRQTAAHELAGKVIGPSARFALTTAVLDAVAHARGKPLRLLLNPGARHEVVLNATIGLVTPTEAARRAQEAVAAGYRTIKLKVGAPDDVARVRAVRAAAPDVSLRLDANGEWEVAEAQARLAELAGFGIEYVEQPVADAGALAALRALTSIPVAADEAAHPLDAAHALLQDEAVDVLVLKPAVCGAWSDVAALLQAAQRAGVRVVFSSALESAVGRTATAQMAAAWLPPELACGLGTGWFDADVRSGEDPIRGGCLCLGSGNGLGFVPRVEGLRTW